MSFDRMDNLMDCLNKEAEKCQKEKRELIEGFFADLKYYKKYDYWFIYSRDLEKWKKMVK